MFIHGHFDGAIGPLRMVKLRDGIGNGAANIIGKVKIEIIDHDIDWSALVCFNAPGEVSRNSYDSDYLYLIVEILRLLWSRIGDAKYISAVKNIGHLRPFGAGIQRYQRHWTAPNSGGSKRSNQQEADRWDKRYT